MTYETRDFGEIQVEPGEIIQFAEPMFGFEQYKNYVLLFDEQLKTDIAWLQSVDNPQVCFILMNSSCLLPLYNPELPEKVLDTLGDGELATWVVCFIPQEFKQATANLKSPVVINPQTRRGIQVILSEEYPVRYSLAKGGRVSC